jgi:photosynthetic reaction center cytochrome c subunit
MTRIATGWKGLAALLLATTLAGCERPPVEGSQIGYRGTAMGQVVNPRIVDPIKNGQNVPAALPLVGGGGPLAKDVYKNVQVLGELDAGEFTRTMLALAAWVSPKEGCTYCHAAGEELASDKLYTKVVARRMLQMTRSINAGWKTHVAETGVTCYTCHRGQPVPAQVWFNQSGPKRAGGFSAESGGHNAASVQAGLTAIDVNVLSRYLVGNEPIRVASTTALPANSPANHPATIKQTENTFGLMIHMSESLGVNCTYCHNTRSHVAWDQSPLQRTKAWYGIRMVRELNNQVLLPLAGTFPANRLGPTGDVAKVACSTCHQGLNKPLGGAAMARSYPALYAPDAAASAAAVAAAAAVPVASIVTSTVSTAVTTVTK